MSTTTTKADQAPARTAGKTSRGSRRGEKPFSGPARPEGGLRGRLGLITLAALLAIGCGLGVAMLIAGAGDKEPALAIARDVPRGQTIEAGDLTTVNLAGDAASVPADQIDQVVGQAATTDLFTGQVLTEQMTSPEALPGKGQAVVGLSLDASRVPAGLEPGDTVDLVAVSGGNGNSSSSQVENPTVLDSSAQVLTVRGNPNTGEMNVSVVTVDRVASRAAAYSAAGRVALVETSGE